MGEMQLQSGARKLELPSAVSIDTRPVAIGYNHDIPHRGRVYHVQTEDSGQGRGHIFTHVFHAGTIVASNRLEYENATPIPDVVTLLRDSHRAMMHKLVHGLLDDAIVRCLGGHGRQACMAVGEPLRGARSGGSVLELAPAATQGPPPHEPHEPVVSHDLAKRLQALIEALDMDNIKQVLETLRNDLAGTLGVALVDYESGMCLGTSGSGLDMEVAAAGNMDVMKAKAKVMRDLGIKGRIEDILITLDSQYHIIRPLGSSMFLYLAIDRQQGNLALARHKLAAAGSEIRL